MSKRSWETSPTSSRCLRPCKASTRWCSRTDPRQPADMEAVDYCSHGHGGPAVVGRSLARVHALVVPDHPADDEMESAGRMERERASSRAAHVCPCLVQVSRTRVPSTLVGPG